MLQCTLNAYKLVQCRVASVKNAVTIDFHRANTSELVLFNTPCPHTDGLKLDVREVERDICVWFRREMELPKLLSNSSDF